MTEVNDVWLEDQEMSPEAKEISNILKGMNIKDRSMTLMEVMAHDSDVMQVVRVRMNWEIRNAVFETLNKENNGDIDQERADAIYGEVLSDEIAEVMPAIWSEEYDEFDVELEE